MEDDRKITLSELLCASPQRVTVYGIAELQAQAAKLCDELQEANEELTRLRDFARSVNEAPTAALAFNNGVDDVVMKPNKHIRSEYMQRSTELIARPARVEGV